MTGRTDSAAYEKIAKTVFAPVYPVIATQILRWSNMHKGVCIDVGAGTGSLGIAIADRAPQMEVILYDISEEMLARAKENVKNKTGICIRAGCVENMPFEDASVDLAVSRGSVFFWDDQVRGFNEIYRVLRPGGFACIGGGFGTVALLHQIQQQMRHTDPAWDDKRRRRIAQNDRNHFNAVMTATRVPAYRIVDKEEGIWVIFTKA